MKHEYKMTCAICNKPFIAGHRCALYCTECKAEQNRERSRQNRLQLKPVRLPVTEEKPKQFPSLSEIVKQAKAANMTYGEYVSMMERGANNADHHN